MTDAESFYLILAVFYLIECLKFCPPGSRAMVSRFNVSRPWVPQQELTRFMGIRKWIFLAPLLPWPKMILISNETNHAGDTKPVDSARNVERLRKLLVKAAFPPRVLSGLIFVFYFLLLPYLYIMQRGDGFFLISIAIGYVLMFAAAALFFKTHKRFLPSDRGNRYKNTLYTALLPWHAMRCTDEITTNYARRWSWPAILAANAEDPDSSRRLMELWRKAHLQDQPTHTVERLEPILKLANLDTQYWKQKPKLGNGQKYCPCCLAIYESNATHCADCRDTELL